jgi:transcriptional regulator with XRE-family HTH domain
MNKKFLSLQLRLLRGQKTQAETAKRFDIAQQTYSGWENPTAGGTPDLTEICSICQHYGCTSDWLLGLSDDKADPKSDKTAQDALAVAEPKMYEAAQTDAAHWRDLAISQQDTIARLARMLEGKAHAAARPAHTGGAHMHAG